MGSNYNSSMNNEINAAVSRMINFLKNGEYEQADASADYLLHLYPGFGSAYIGKLLAEFHLNELNDLLYTDASYTGSDNYKHALYYSDPDTQRFLKTAPYENFYLRAKKKMEDDPTDTGMRVAAGMFRQISGYRDSDELFRKCSAAVEKNRLNELYQKAVELMNSASDENSWQAAADAFACVNGYSDSGEKRNECLQKANEFRMDAVYNSAVAPEECETLEALKDSLRKYESIKEWKDAGERAEKCRKMIHDYQQAVKSKTRIRILAVVLSILLIAVACGVIFVIIPLSKYNRGNELINKGQYDEAAEVFASLNGYRDSETKIREIREMVRENRYQAAISLMNEGKYLEASEAFAEMEGYKDSIEKAAEAKSLYLEKQYNDAVQLIASDHLVEGIQILLVLGDYKDSPEVINNALTAKAQSISLLSTAEVAAELESMDPEITTSILERMDAEKVAHLTLFAAVDGDILNFGQYEQDNDAENGEEPIEWIVLDHQKGYITMISRYALDTRPYNEDPAEITWEDSSLRKWLNDDFYPSAFSQEEKAMIIPAHNDNPAFSENLADAAETDDLVYLLNNTEAEQFFETDDERRVKATAYALEKGAETEDGYASWWLRSSGYDLRNAAYVYTDGAVHHNGIYVFSAQDAVRPVIQIMP